MNKYIRNLVLGVSSAAMIFCSFIPSYAATPTVIHEVKTSENISSGVVHENIKQFNYNGWWNINVLRIDLDDEYTDIKALFSKDGISKRDTVSNMMDSSNVVGAINGDFFSTISGTSFPLGAVIDNGEIISSPIDINYKLPVFSIDYQKNPTMSYWDWTIKAITPNGEEIILSAINKESQSHEEIIAYDKNWGTQSIGNKVFNDLIEIVIIDDYVSEIRIGQPPISFPEDGYIITGRGAVREKLLNNFKIGDKVDLQINTSFDYQNLKAAIGGGSFLLKDGEKTSFNINITGNHPRTALGITQDKKQLIMVTVDGRDTSFKGVSQTVLADIMLELGAYDAINLDGGGSTTMAIKPTSVDSPIVVNKPSDGSERRIVNGIGVISNAPKGELSYIKVYTNDDKMFVNTTRSFYIKGYDKYHNPIEIDENKVQFFINGVEGIFDKNVLTAKSTGEGTVRAFYDGIMAEGKIKVLDSVEDLQLENEKIGVDTSSEISLGKIYGKNSKGYTALIEPNDIMWETIGKIGHIENGILYSSDKATAGAVVAKVENAVESILVSVGFEEVLINDFESLEEISFISYPEEVTGELVQSLKSKVGNRSIKLKYDFTGSDNTRAAYIALGDSGIVLDKKPEKIGIWVYGNESNSWLRGQLSDATGKTIRLDFSTNVDWKGWKFVTANIPSDAVQPLVLERIYVAEVNPLNKYTGELLLDGLKAMYPNPIDISEIPTSTVAKDTKQRTVDKVDNGYKFIVSFGIEKLDTLYKLQIAKQINNSLSNSKYGFFMGNTDENIGLGTKATKVNIVSGYQSTKEDDLLFIKADNSKGGIRASNPEQWLWFKNDLESSAQKNIVILMPNPVFGSNGFTDKLEAELFHDTLTQYAEKDKNIWVVYSGSKNEVDLIDGIRYVELNKPNLNSTDSIFDLQQLEFVYNNGELTYDFISIFKKTS